MSELADAIQAIGLPVVGLGAASGIYKLSAIIEKTARPEALREISKAISQTDLIAIAQRKSLVPALFDITFGSRHLSLKCVRRSALISLCVFAAMVLWYLLRSPTPIVSGIKPGSSAIYVTASLILGFVVFLLLPDYLALWKARFCLSLKFSRKPLIQLVLLCVVDAFLSIALSVTIIVATVTLTGKVTQPNGMPFANYLMQVLSMAEVILFEFPYTVYHGGLKSFANLFLFSPFSTLLTSVWMLTTAASVALLRLLIPLQYVRRFTMWLFDTKKHPIKAIGMMAGAIIFAGSLVWHFVRLIV